MIAFDAFRDGETARLLAAAIAAEVRPERDYAFMEFCGGHTHAICRYAIADLLPGNLRMIHGPGCPVCVLPVGRVDAAIAIAERPGVTLCSFGDVLRIPGSRRRSLMAAKAAGADVRIVYSPLDALALAQAAPEREVVFFAVGFETTTPPTAAVLARARSLGIGNFSVFCNHVLTPPAIAAILGGAGGPTLDGILGPAHVAAVTGGDAFARFARDDHMPVVIAGFEPLDVLQAILMLVRQANAGAARVEIQFRRGVTEAGNRAAQALTDEVFELRPAFAWRGLGQLAASGLRPRPAFAAWDAEARFAIGEPPPEPRTACRCAEILRGRAEPADCPLFGSACTPESPAGACMVSSEGACAAEWTYGRGRRRIRKELP
ncbi:protein required for maturation of hydrogenases [uncultured Alphaproteobacteria bacterium]|uniref:Hydrogenase maturation factor n=1 Tax=uncultured Alphaproteobacteria bacterium TaxID=91750 RepID=A0A212K316_9PROT|nr:protein required for maturation of hydrogenases [uncultured Alphaproteobacteria bacterium]